MLKFIGLASIVKQAKVDLDYVPLAHLIRTAHTITVGSRNAPPKPRKTPLNAYQLFVKEKMADRSDEKNAIDKFRNTAAEWKNMTDEDKNVYRERYTQCLFPLHVHFVI